MQPFVTRSDEGGENVGVPIQTVRPPTRAVAARVFLSLIGAEGGAAAHGRINADPTLAVILVQSSAHALANSSKMMVQTTGGRLQWQGRRDVT